MKSMRSVLFCCLIGICSLGCVRTGIDSRIEKAFDGLIIRFPQLPKGEKKLTDFYIQVRTVEFHQFQIQLWSTPEQIADKQNVVVFVNPAGCCCAVPLLSNKYRDYWAFEFDRVIPSVSKVSTTFEKELLHSFRLLNVGDSSGAITSGQILHELFFSVLHCERIRARESLVNEDLFCEIHTDLPEENNDSCLERARNNEKDIFSKLATFKDDGWYTAFGDEGANRIYLLREAWGHQREQFSIKVYRQDCNRRLIDL